MCKRLRFLLNSTLYQHNIRYSESSALHWAARCGRIETLRKVLDVPVSRKVLSCVDSKSGQTALSTAAQQRHLEIVKLLLSVGADPNTPTRSGESLFCWAAKYGHLEPIKLLQQHGAWVGVGTETESRLLPLLWAACGRHYHVAAFLRNALQLDLWIESANKHSLALLLSVTAACGWKAPVQQILERGCPVDAIWRGGTEFSWPQKDLTPIRRAAANGHFGVVELLLRHKADPNLPPGLAADWGPMFWAIQGGHLIIVKLLLDHGAEPNLLDSRERSALTLALPRRAIFHLLLCHGVHVIDKRVIFLSRILVLSSLLSLACYKFVT